MNHVELVQLGANYATIIQGVTGIAALALSVLAIKISANPGSLKKNSPVMRT